MWKRKIYDSIFDFLLVTMSVKTPKTQRRGKESEREREGERESCVGGLELAQQSWRRFIISDLIIMNCVWRTPACFPKKRLYEKGFCRILSK